MKNQTTQMLKVALVGHSQIPRNLEIPNVQIKIFRGPGAKARTFFEDNRVNKILEWEHDLTILWIGSNDIEQTTNPARIFCDIKNIIKEITAKCQSLVYICQVEPRTNPRNITEDQYKKFQVGINNRIKRALKTPNIHFNNQQFVQELSEDGTHWDERGRAHVLSKFRRVIENFNQSRETVE